MATFETCVRNIKDYSTVYIRVIHNSKPAYIKTGLIATKKQLKGKIVKDNLILVQSLEKIKEYINKINQVDIRNWDVNKLVEYLNQDKDISFSAFAKEFYKNKKGTYKYAVSSLQKFLKKDDIMFSDISTHTIAMWLKSLENTKQAKADYPVLLKTIFNAGLIRYNDYDNGNILIKHNPFLRNKPANREVPVKRNLDRLTIQKILFFNTDRSLKSGKVTLAKEVGRLVFCLAGMNTADIYTGYDLKRGKVCYNREKTKNRRVDKSYIEITIPEQVSGMLGKEYHYSTKEQFNKTVNAGLKEISRILGLKRNVTSYYFRHSWANIAKNVFNYSDADIAFALNHISAHKTTGLYFDKNFNLVDRMNRKVINYVFYRKVNASLLRK